MLSLANMKQRLVGLLTFLHLVDPHDGQVSMTSLALYAGIGRMVVTPAPTYADIATLLLPLLAAAHKRTVGANMAPPPDETLRAELDVVKAKVATHGDIFVALKNRGVPGPGAR